jgi:hypothetical protein
MHLLERNHKRRLRSSFEKGMSQVNPATEEDTDPMDSVSEMSCTGPTAEDDTFTDNWTGLYESDVDATLSSPPHKALIDRTVKILEKHIINVMMGRQADIAILQGLSRLVLLAESPAALCKSGLSDHPLVLDGFAKQELTCYVSTIASKYNDVLYHNFEHASHVLGSADSLISILKQNPKRSSPKRGSSSTISSRLSSVGGDSDDDDRKHVCTFGISSCPMTHLALVFSALVHDVEHQGVGNQQLINEEDPLAIEYNGKSVAENNSLDVARNLLSQDCYSNLRESMFGHRDSSPRNTRNMMNADEDLFYSVILGTIQATDICSKDRLDRNKEKWIEAFEDATSYSSSRESTCCCDVQNRRSSVPQSARAQPARTRRLSMSHASQMKKCTACTMSSDECFMQLDFLRATSVLEQMIQAADVAHSMQSWPIFMKWNTKLYYELWAAKLAGRGPDVSANWFKGQIGFFDFYITPLAKRLQQCGVFGDSGGLFLENLDKNRARWLREGEDQCKEMHDRVIKQQGDGGCVT